MNDDRLSIHSFTTFAGTGAAKAAAPCAGVSNNSA
jgi:hypothetical protein